MFFTAQQLALGRMEQMERIMKQMERSMKQMERSMEQMERSMEQMKVENKRAINIGPEMDQDNEG